MTEFAALRAQSYNASLVDVIACNDTLRIVRVRPDAGVPSFSPGQYVSLGLGLWEPRVAGAPDEALRPGQETRLCKRPYSLSHPLIAEETGELATPATLDFLELYVTLIDRAAGEKIAGHYTLETVKPTDNVVFLSTGTGEAPHNAMIWELLRRGHRGRIVSLVGVRYRQDLAYLARHRVLERRFARYRYITLTTREPEDAGKRRYLQDYFAEGSLERELGFDLVPAKTHVFLCGNPEMMGIPKGKGGVRAYPSPRGLIEVLESRGFRADNRREKTVGNVHFEEYW